MSEFGWDYNLTGANDSSVYQFDNKSALNLHQPYDADVDLTSDVANYVAIYYTPILVFSGTIGNILSVIVFFKTKLRKLSSSYYLAALAISDTGFLIGAFVAWLPFVDIDIYSREYFCQFFTFFSNLCSFCSVWFVVAFTVERFIAVMYPLKRQTMCTVRRAKMVLCGLTIVGFVHCLPFIYFARSQINAKDKSIICDIRRELKEYVRMFNYIDTVMVFAVPFTTIVVLNTFTGCTVWKFANVRRKMTMQKKRNSLPHMTTRSNFSSSTYRLTTVRAQHSLISNCSSQTGRNGSVYKTKPVARKIGNSSQIKVTKMLLIVSTVFVCLNLPSYVLRVGAYLTDLPSNTAIVSQYISWFLFLTNFGINFVLYCVSGQNFRKAVISLFQKVSSTSQREATTQVTVSDYYRNSGTGASRRRLGNRMDSWTDMHELKQVPPFK